MIDYQRSKSRPKAIILGGGFAGLNAAKTLGSALVELRDFRHIDTSRTSCVVDMDGRPHIFSHWFPKLGFGFRLLGAHLHSLRDGVRLIVGSRELPGWDSLSKETMPAPEPVDQAFAAESK